MEQKYTCIFLKFRHPRMLRDLLTQNLQHQQTLQKSGCERPCGDHRHLLTVPSNHQREEKAQNLLRFQRPLPRFKTCGVAREELLPLRPPGPANGSSDSAGVRWPSSPVTRVVHGQCVRTCRACGHLTLHGRSSRLWLAT